MPDCWAPLCLSVCKEKIDDRLLCLNDTRHLACSLDHNVLIIHMFVAAMSHPPTHGGETKFSRELRFRCRSREAGPHCAFPGVLPIDRYRRLHGPVPLA